MNSKVHRRTVDLFTYLDLVVVYLGMRVNASSGLKTLFGFGPKIAAFVQDMPERLLLHETFMFSVFPPHGGDAPILAGFRIPCIMGPFRTSPRMVAAIPA
jgi:hypothetical protein